MSTVWRPASDAVASDVEGGAVVLHLRTKRYYSLNDTGAVAWDAMRDGATTDEIVAALRARFAVDEPQARLAVDRLVSELHAESLIVAGAREAP